MKLSTLKNEAKKIFSKLDTVTGVTLARYSAVAEISNAHELYAEYDDAERITAYAETIAPFYTDNVSPSRLSEVKNLILSAPYYDDIIASYNSLSKKHKKSGHQTKFVTNCASKMKRLEEFDAETAEVVFLKLFETKNVSGQSHVSKSTVKNWIKKLQDEKGLRGKNEAIEALQHLMAAIKS